MAISNQTLPHVSAIRRHRDTCTICKHMNSKMRNKP